MVDFVVDGVVGADGPFGLNGLMDLLTDGTAAASVDLATLLPAPLVLPIPGLFNATVALELYLYNCSRPIRISFLNGCNI